MSGDRWLRAGEPDGPILGGSRSLGGLVSRLASEGRLVALRRNGRAVDAAEVDHLEVRGIVDDSRRATPGTVFAAVRGLRVDGHEFAADTAAAGATAVMVEHALDGLDGLDAVQIVVDRSPAALASAAAWWFGDPSRELTVVGVTGTNGKTTTTFLAAAALEGVGWRTGIVGTIGIRVGGVMRPNDLPTTTPGAIDLQRLLRGVRLADERAVVLEASSHGLAADRVGSVAFDAAIFTNLSHEHLDFHGTFEAYRAAKLSLFERLPVVGIDGRPGVGVVNIDDEHGPAFRSAARRSGAHAITYGAGPTADVRLVTLEADASASRLEADARGRRVSIGLRIGGRFNALNALAALGLGVGWGLDLDLVVAGLESVGAVPGRMEAVDRGQPFHVIVDYAHTPGSLEAVARELSELAEPHGGRVISVFGASGERDVGKRPLMGHAAGRWSRLVVATEDDSRNEDPGQILDAIATGAEAAGLVRGTDLLVIPSRREAIAEAFGRARPGDVVLLAGKGHETWNMGPGGAEPWNERAVAAEILAAMGYRGSTDPD